MTGQPVQTTAASLSAPPRRTRAISYVLVGAVCGLAWAAGFRAFMRELAGYDSQFGWGGTFGGILAPGLIVGGLLGLAAAKIATGRNRGVRWFVLSPLLLAVAPMLLPGALLSFLAQGLGGGAVLVALLAMAGGCALGTVGPRWARAVCGLVGVLGIGAAVVAVPLVGGARLALTEPEGLWVGALAASFVAVLMIATSIPLRRVVASTDHARSALIDDS